MYSRYIYAYGHEYCSLFFTTYYYWSSPLFLDLYCLRTYIEERHRQL